MQILSSKPSKKEKLDLIIPVNLLTSTINLKKHNVNMIKQKLNIEQGRRAFQVVLVVKSLPANAGDRRVASSNPGLGRSPGEGLGNPLQYSCLEISMDRGAWRATVHGVAKSRTRLSTLNFSSL